MSPTLRARQRGLASNTQTRKLNSVRSKRFVWGHLLTHSLVGLQVLFYRPIRPLHFFFNLRFITFAIKKQHYYTTKNKARVERKCKSRGSSPSYLRSLMTALSPQLVRR